MRSTFVFFRSFLIVAAALLFTGAIGQAGEMDDRIESSAKDSYVFKAYLKDDNVKLDSKDGLVTITGEVANEDHRSLAQETVSNLPGVTSVDNQLTVKIEEADKNTDAWIGIKVKTALLFHSNVSGTRTQVEVTDGVVTLRGEADNLAQKDLATEYAKDVEGVKSVTNEIAIVEPPKVLSQKISEKIDDASITAQVKMALLAHRSTSVINTKVNTDNGVVFLTGKAKNEAEKELVTKLVTDIKGVENVINNMNVESSS